MTLSKRLISEVHLRNLVKPQQRINERLGGVGDEEALPVAGGDDEGGMPMAFVSCVFVFFFLRTNTVVEPLRNQNIPS